MIRQVVSTFLGRSFVVENEERRDKTREREREAEKARDRKRGDTSDVRIGSRESPWLLECGPLEPGYIQVVQRGTVHVYRAHTVVYGRTRVPRPGPTKSVKSRNKSLKESVIAIFLRQPETEFLFNIPIYNCIFKWADDSHCPNN